MKKGVGPLNAFACNTLLSYSSLLPLNDEERSAATRDLSLANGNGRTILQIQFTQSFHFDSKRRLRGCSFDVA